MSTVQISVVWKCRIEFATTSLALHFESHVQCETYVQCQQLAMWIFSAMRLYGAQIHPFVCARYARFVPTCWFNIWSFYCEQKWSQFRRAKLEISSNRLLIISQLEFLEPECAYYLYWLQVFLEMILDHLGFLVLLSSVVLFLFLYILQDQPGPCGTPQGTPRWNPVAAREQNAARTLAAQQGPFQILKFETYETNSLRRRNCWSPIDNSSVKKVWNM